MLLIIILLIVLDGGIPAGTQSIKDAHNVGGASMFRRNFDHSEHAVRPKRILPAERQTSAGRSKEGEIQSTGRRSFDAVGGVQQLEEQQIFERLVLRKFRANQNVEEGAGCQETVARYHGQA